MFFGVDIIIVFLTVLMVFGVAYINGWTDAPNSIAACVSTGVIPLKKAVRIAAVADFAGSVSVGLLNNKVTERIIILSEMECPGEIFISSMFSVMLSVIVFAVLAWYFGIPTSESHAMLAGLFGSGLIVERAVDLKAWINTLVGLVISLLSGFISGYIISEFFSRVIRIEFNDKLKKSQILICVLTSFLHGALDSQKFAGILMVIFRTNGNINNKTYLVVLTVTAFMISCGILTGGDRIIKSVGNDLIKLNKLQGFSADVSGLLCLGISTFCGIPVSTTHIKTASVFGAGAVNGSTNHKLVMRIIVAWILTFPVCALLSCCITYIIIK